MKKLFLYLFAILFPYMCHAQVIYETILGTEFSERGNDIIELDDSNYVFCGSTEQTNNGSSGILIMKVDPAGNLVWIKSMSSQKQLFGYSIVQTTDQGFLITGQEKEFITGLSDIVLLKTDKSGDLIWQKNIDFGDGDCGYDIIRTSDNNYLICGSSHSIDKGTDAIMIKTNPDGEILWKKYYGTDYTDAAYSVIETFDNNYVLGGITLSPELTDLNAFFVKTDPDGDTLWTSNCGSGGNEWINDISQVYDSGFVACGWTENGSGNPDALLIKTDLTGNILWSKNFGGNGNDAALSIQYTAGGNILMTGYFGEELSNDIWLLKTSPDGTLLWEQKYGKSRRMEEGLEVIQTLDHGIVVCGRILNAGNQDDIYLVKSDSAGNTGQTGFYNEIKVNTTKVYPNPTSGLVFIESKDEIINIKLYGMDGSLSYEMNPKPEFTNMLDLRYHNKGIFLLEINTKRGTRFQKIILW